MTIINIKYIILFAYIKVYDILEEVNCSLEMGHLIY